MLVVYFHVAEQEMPTDVDNSSKHMYNVKDRFEADKPLKEKSN